MKFEKMRKISVLTELIAKFSSWANLGKVNCERKCLLSSIASNFHVI